VEAIDDAARLFDPNVVKVVRSPDARSISLAPILAATRRLCGRRRTNSLTQRAWCGT
jgi:hypothetical protein